MTGFFLSKDFIILIVSLALLVVCASFMYDSSDKWVLWKYDDTEHLSVAYNLFHGKGLFMDFIDNTANHADTNIPTLKLYNQISNPLRDKGPLYFVLLGGWLKVTSANYSNWYFWGVIFNFLLIASSIVIFYLFTRRYFGINIAAFATPILALIPGLLWFSVRIRPDALVFIFFITGIYFICRGLTLKNVVLTGLFVSMAELTHSIGAMLGLTVIIYLLYKHKFKYAGVFIAIWILAITPWMIRNYIIFGDATQGFGIPLPSRVSIALGLVSPSIANLSVASYGVNLANIPSLYSNLGGMLNEFTLTYGMEFFMAFIACSVAAYLSFPSIRRALISSENNKVHLRKENIVLVSGWISLYIVLIIWSYSRINAIQIITLVLIPLLGYLYLRLRSHHKQMFTSNGKDVYTVLGIFGVVSLLIYLVLIAVVFRTPEVRFIYPSLFMLVPVAIVGIKKLLEVLYRFPALSLRFSSTHFTSRKAISLSLVTILVIFSITQTTAGINAINGFEKPFAEKEYQKKIDKWVVDNIPAGAKIASELPHAVLLQTGHQAVNFYFGYKDNVSYERWIIKKFDIDYLVFYYPKNQLSPGLSSTDLGSMKLDLVYQARNSTTGPYEGMIYKVVNK